MSGSSGCPFGYTSEPAPAAASADDAATATATATAASSSSSSAAAAAAGAVSEGTTHGAQRRYKHAEGAYYHDYLGLDKILSAQHRRSEANGHAAHDEMVFIVVHQAYELWFKEILFEAGSVIELLRAPFIADSALNTVYLRLSRVHTILKLLVQQMDVVETITPLDFLDFRDDLVPASGFQSLQFRQFEIALGMRQESRNSYQQRVFHEYFRADHQQTLRESEANQVSLFDVVERWLARMPFLESASFNWAAEFRAAVDAMLTRDEQTIRDNPLFGEEQRDAQLKELARTRAMFDSVLDADKYESELRSKGLRRLSYRASLAALMIYLYRDEAVFQLPFRVLSTLVDIDEQIVLWRHRHQLMVSRMIGSKIGTGGSSGYGYLKTTLTDKYRVFADFANTSSFLLPRSALPALPDALRRQLGNVWATERGEASSSQ